MATHAAMWTHAVDGSAAARACTISRDCRGSHSAPPSSRGVHIPNSRSACSASATASTSLPAASLASAFSRTRGTSRWAADTRSAPSSWPGAVSDAVVVMGSPVRGVPGGGREPGPRDASCASCPLGAGLSAGRTTGLGECVLHATSCQEPQPDGGSSDRPAVLGRNAAYGRAGAGAGTHAGDAPSGSAPRRGARGVDGDVHLRKGADQVVQRPLGVTEVESGHPRREGGQQGLALHAGQPLAGAAVVAHAEPELVHHVGPGDVEP